MSYLGELPVGVTESSLGGVESRSGWVLEAARRPAASRQTCTQGVSYTQITGTQSWGHETRLLCDSCITGKGLSTGRVSVSDNTDADLTVLLVRRFTVTRSSHTTCTQSLYTCPV